jgi:3-hydroxyisobutyrate dehydrogenase-like beta-hydroxyacid dehydrogenase
MRRVGVIGLGNIGGAIATNLVADSHEVVVFDLDADRVSSVDGAKPAGSVAEVGAATDITLTSLPTPDVVTAVAREWAGAAAPGSVLVDLSTTLPATNQAIAEELAASGHHFVEAPLTGGAIGARNRALVFMVGGEGEAVCRVLPVLEPLGRATFHLGPIGTATTMKLANSLLAFTCTWASFEALSMAVRAGIDLRTAVEVVRTGGATNFYVDRGVENINRRGGETMFALELAAKDANLIREVAQSSDVSGVMAEAMVAVLEDAVARGLGDHDWQDLVIAAEQRSGVELTIAPKDG